MKKYIAFFVGIGILLGTILIYNVTHIRESKKVAFSEAGYILNGTDNRYYFAQNEKYTTSNNDQIVFNDTEGDKVTVNNSNFVHYNSGNIVALQEGVLLDLEKINDNPIVYYNVAANKEIKRVSTRYTVKNLDSDLQFEQAIWKISTNKYIILANNLKINLSNGITKEAEGYLEVEYSDNEIVSIYNQEFNSQTISSNSYIELQNGIKLNLGTKIVSQNDVNKMSLEDMVINSNDNVTLVDLNNNNDDNNENKEETEQEEKNEITENKTQTANNNSSTTTTKTDTTTTTSNSTTIVTQDNGTSSSDFNDDKNAINIITPDIIYEYVNENENKVDETIPAKEPKFKLEDMSVTAVGIQGNLQIQDDDDTLSKNDDINIKIVNSDTGKVVYTDVESYGIFNIPINIETLTPDTNYSITVSATYVVDEKNYTKDFLYKAFVTTSAGVEISKESYTDNSLSFNIGFTDELIDSAEVTLLDGSGNEIPNRKQTIKNSATKENIVFDGLTPDTDYTVRISKISYNGIIQESDNWTKDTKCKTLKTKASINKLNYSVNKRNGTFTLRIEDIADTNNAIQSYKYVMYKYTQVRDENGKETLDYDTKNIVFEKTSTEKEVEVPVSSENNESGVVRGQYYGFKVIATTYDNEKYVDIESNICGAFTLSGANFPSVKFEKVESDSPPTEIRGWLYIIDNDNTVIVDKDNPLTITYYSDVDEGNAYIKRTSLEADEKTTDTDGNEVIRLWIDLGEKGNNKKGLKAETSYTFAAYGTINLKDDNGDYKNAHIGSAIVTTSSYQPLTANMSVSSNSATTFTVDLNLAGDDVAREGLSSVNLMLYEGSGDINNGEYKNWSRTITESNFTSCLDNVKDNAQVNSLQELFFDNTLEVTPSFIAGGKESSYTELNYQVIVTATIDGTKYTNKIPIQSADDKNENTGNTTYTDKKTSETYSAAYIIVKGKGTTVDVPDEYKKADATAITNGNASKYGIEKNNDLDNDTYVGYYVSTSFANTGSLIAKDITYYLWDRDGNPVLDENGNQIIKKANFLNQEKAPSAIFTLNKGTIDTAEYDNNSGMHRGDAYFVSYTVTYQDANGNEILWPNCKSDENNTYTNKSLKTDILYPQKQEPRFMIYPKISDETSITYIYSCIDIDKALYYAAHSTTEYGYLNLSVNGTTQSSNIEVKTDGQQHETVVSGLVSNTTYQLGYIRNLNKVQSGVYTSKNLVKQKFEGIVNCDDVKIQNIIYNDANNPNSVIVQLTGNSINRVAAATLTLDNGQEQISTGLLKLNTDSGNYIKADLLEMLNNDNVKHFTDRDVNVKVNIYYDDGRIGFALGENQKYSTYVNANNMYMSLVGNKFDDSKDINGNMYEYRFYPSEDKVQLGIKNIDDINKSQNGTTVELQYSPEGLKQNGNVIVQKEVITKELQGDKQYTINIKNIRLGIKINTINSTITTANIKAKLISPLSVNINKLTMEIWHSKNAKDSPDWNNATNKEISVEQLENLTLDNLFPAEYYYIRFKYLDNGTYTYTYDVDSKEIGNSYKFETLATIGIDNIKVEYEAQNYSKKFINISYDVNAERSTMYAKTRYTFYKKDGLSKVELTDKNIQISDENAAYTIIDGSIEITNSKQNTDSKFDKVTEQININPESNVFTMGEEYVLKITPIAVINNNQDCELETEETKFTLKKLIEPSIGLKMERKQTTSNEKFLKVLVSIKDTDAMIYGSDWGEYNIHVYRYKDNKDQATEVNIYDKSQGGKNITGNVLNLKNNTINYSVYVQNKDIDYTYNYMVKLQFKYDKENNGKSLEDRTVQYILKSISNDANVSIGSATLVQNENKCEVRFYDSYYNINKIDRIDYSVYNLNNNYNKTGYYVPQWSSESQDQNVTYFKTQLPIEFDTKATYTVKLNLYVGDILVGQIDTTYIYE